MTRTVRSRRAESVPRPLYARVLRLRNIAPSGLLCFVFLEGAVVLGILLALAELVSWWGVLVLPITVALMVKFNDLVAGAFTPRTVATETTSARTSVLRPAAMPTPREFAHRGPTGSVSPAHASASTGVTADGGHDGHGPAAPAHASGYGPVGPPVPENTGGYGTTRSRAYGGTEYTGVYTGRNAAAGGGYGSTTSESAGAHRETAPAAGSHGASSSVDLGFGVPEASEGGLYDEPEPGGAGLYRTPEPDERFYHGPVPDDAGLYGSGSEPAATGLYGGSEPAAAGLYGSSEPAAARVYGSSEPAAAAVYGESEPAGGGIYGASVPGDADESPAAGENYGVPRSARADDYGVSRPRRARDYGDPGTDRAGDWGVPVVGRADGHRVPDLEGAESYGSSLPEPVGSRGYATETDSEHSDALGTLPDRSTAFRVSVSPVPGRDGSPGSVTPFAASADSPGRAGRFGPTVSPLDTRPGGYVPNASPESSSGGYGTAVAPEVVGAGYQGDGLAEVPASGGPGTPTAEYSASDYRHSAGSDYLSGSAYAGEAGYEAGVGYDRGVGYEREADYERGADYKRGAGYESRTRTADLAVGQIPSRPAGSPSGAGDEARPVGNNAPTRRPWADQLDVRQQIARQAAARRYE